MTRKNVVLLRRCAAVFSLSICLFVFTGLDALEAQQIARVAIYRVPIKFVCGTPVYTDPPNCQTFAAADFERLQRTGRLLAVYQADFVPPLLNRFNDSLVRDSRFYNDYATFKTDAALVVVTWLGQLPRRVEVRREDFEGNELGKEGPFQRSLGRGRFFYHFPFEQVGRLILTLRSSLPPHEFTYRP